GAFRVELTDFVAYLVRVVASKAIAVVVGGDGALDDGAGVVVWRLCKGECRNDENDRGYSHLLRRYTSSLRLSILSPPAELSRRSTPNRQGRWRIWLRKSIGISSSCGCRMRAWT